MTPIHLIIAGFVYSVLIPIPLYCQDFFEIQSFATGLDLPMDITNAGGSLLYIAERKGKIRIVNPDGSLGPIMLDITDSIPSISSEKGFLGLAFHPEYPDSSYLYTHYIGTGGDTKVARFDVISDTEADPNSGKILLSVDQPFSNHNGGGLSFDGQGYLYICIGDGGSSGDPFNNGQDLKSYLGKILRIDIDQGDPYAIPPDNPYATDTSALPEIWGYGFRNPFRVDYDPFSDALYVGDVGQGSWEEIDRVPTFPVDDPNYGWRCYEGNHAYNLSDCDSVENLIWPIYEYSHTDAIQCSGSITGGVVYRGSRIPCLFGKYLYADYCTGQIGSVDIDNGNQQDSLLDFTNRQIVSFGEDISGEVYFAAIGQGTIYKFIPKDTQFVFTVALDSTGTGSASKGSGYGLAVYDIISGELKLSGSYTSLFSIPDSARIQLLTNDSIILNLDILALSDSSGEFSFCDTIPVAIASLFIKQELQLVIYSSNYPGGEIQGPILQSNCPELLNISAPSIPSWIYSGEMIISNGDINSPSTVIFQFEQSAELLPGFEMQKGATFEVIYKVCSD